MIYKGCQNDVKFGGNSINWKFYFWFNFKTTILTLNVSPAEQNVFWENAEISVRLGKGRDLQALRWLQGRDCLWSENLLGKDDPPQRLCVMGCSWWSFPHGGRRRRRMMVQDVLTSSRLPLWQQMVRQRIQTQPLQGFGAKEKLYRLMGLLNRRWAKSRTPHWNRQTEEERPGGSYGSKKCPVTFLGNMGKRGASLKKMLSPESPDPFV